MMMHPLSEIIMQYLTNLTRQSQFMVSVNDIRRAIRTPSAYHAV